MIEHLIVILVGTFALGLATWHLTRVVADGALFAGMRRWLSYCEGTFWKIILESIGCRLCLNTQAAFALTWGALMTGLLVRPNELPLPEWAFAFAVGPFIVAAWAEVMRRIECLEVPE